MIVQSKLNFNKSTPVISNGYDTFSVTEQVSIWADQKLRWAY